MRAATGARTWAATSIQRDGLSISLIVPVILGISVYHRFFDDWIGSTNRLSFFVPMYSHLGDRLRAFDIHGWNPYVQSGRPLPGTWNPAGCTSRRFMNGRTQNYHSSKVMYGGLDSRLFDMLGVRYIIVDARIPADRDDCLGIANRRREVFRNQYIAIFENIRAYPGAWIVHDVRDNNDGAGMLASLGWLVWSERARPARRSWLERRIVHGQVGDETQSAPAPQVPGSTGPGRYTTLGP